MDPNIPKTRNQRTITGPNSLPIEAVPNCCTINTIAKMTMVIPTTGVLGENILSPSTADMTVKEGVIILSATKVEAPIIATTYSHFFLTREYRDKIPPSPLLSARNAMMTYLMVVCIVRVQMIQDKAPSIYSSNGKFPVPCRAFTIAFIT